MKPLSFSIITVTLNSEKYLAATLESILSQDYTDKEVLVVDGGSKDSTLEILKGYEGKVRYVSEPDRGISHAMNKGIKLSGGDIIAHLHSDDIYLPGAISRAAQIFSERPGIKWLYGKGNYIDEKGEMRGTARTEKYSYETLESHNCIFHPAVFLRREVFNEVGYFDESLQYAMDYDLWMRMGKRYEPCQSDEIFTSFRQHGGSLSTRNALLALDEEYMVRKRYCGNALPLRKAFFFLRYKAARTAKRLHLI